MEPLMAASTFATIVGLLSNFKSERQSVSNDEYKTFLEWLQDKRHNEILKYLETNQHLVDGIRNFLKEDNKIILQKLEAIDNVTSKIALGIEGLAEIAGAINPNKKLSAQCINILRQLSNSGGSGFIESKTMGGSRFAIIEGQGGDITYDAPRFLEDDLRTLVELGLLRLDHGTGGRRIFYLTRVAVNFLQSANVAKT